MAKTIPTQKQLFQTKFSELFANYNKGTADWARQFVVAICWVGYWTAAFFAVALFIPAVIVKAAKIAYKVTKEGRA